MPGPAGADSAGSSDSPDQAAPPEGTPADSPPSPPSPPKGSPTPRRLIAVLASVAAFMALLLVVRAYALTPFRIPTSSMEPTLLGESAQHPGDTILVNRLAYLGAGPARWEVVAFRAVEKPGTSDKEPPAIVKRVVGLPGEKIEISGGEVYVNDQLAAKPAGLRDVHYIASGSFGWRTVELGPDEYFVLGDNSYLSQDSRSFGPLPRKNIFGRVIWVFLPWARMGWVH
jgi:signal peptidase I